MTPSDEIEAARREIDEIDDRIVGLLERRASCAVVAGRAKRRTGAPVRDAGREAFVLGRVASLARGRLDGPGIVRVYERIMELMRRLEEEDARAQKHKEPDAS